MRTVRHPIALPCQPIDFIGKPILPIALQRALDKAENAN